MGKNNSNKFRVLNNSITMFYLFLGTLFSLFSFSSPSFFDELARSSILPDPNPRMSSPEHSTPHLLYSNPRTLLWIMERWNVVKHHNQRWVPNSLQASLRWKKIILTNWGSQTMALPCFSYFWELYFPFLVFFPLPLTNSLGPPSFLIPTLDS